MVARISTAWFAGFAGVAIVLVTTLVVILSRSSWEAPASSPNNPDIAVSSELEDEEQIELTLRRWESAVADLVKDQTAESQALADKTHAEFENAVTKASNRYRALLQEATQYYSNPQNDIYTDVLSTRHMLQDKMIAASIEDILRGAVEAARRSPNLQKANTQIRSFDYIYQTYREDGLGHSDAVAKIIELEKL